MSWWRALFTRTPQNAHRHCPCATMPVDFTKNAEEHPEPQKAEVKGEATSPLLHAFLFSFFFLLPSKMSTVHSETCQTVAPCCVFFFFAQGTFPAGCKALCCAMARVSSPWARPATSTGSTAWPSCTASPSKMVRPCAFSDGNCALLNKCIHETLF